jgi:NADH dehydrogenase [ubiquinone] 1 alpha subcomplex assembly factor 1
MKTSILLVILLTVAGASAADPTPGKLVLFDFNTDSYLRGWRIQDDVVMGGRSKGSFALNEKGHAVFSGEVSLENDGGFSSVQNYFDPIDVSPYDKAFVRLRGDGKSYRFIVESDRSDRHYYVHEFQTGTDWQTVEVPLAGMYPMRRGDRLSIPDYPGQTMAQVRFMIANGKPEAFRLEIDKIWLE